MSAQTYKVRDPQGNIREIYGPAGASDDEIIAQAKRLFGGEKPPIKQIDVNGPDPTGSGAQNFMAGVGKAIMDTGRGVGQLGRMTMPDRMADAIGLPSQAEIDETKRLDAPLMKTTGGMLGNIAGNIGIALAPGAVLSRAGGATGTVGKMMNAAPATWRGAAVGAATGAGLAGIQPVASDESRVANMTVGGVAGSAFPVAGMAFKAGKSAVEPLYAGGREVIVGRALRSAAGDKADDVARALAASSQPFVGPSMPGQARTVMGEIVPGSMPTAADVAANPGIAAMQRAASAVDPAAYGAREAAQNASRVAVLRDMAGGDGERAFAAANRDATAKQLYEQAYQKGIDISRDATTGQMLSKAQVAGRRGEITNLLKRPAIQDAMKEARRLAANEGVNMKDLSGSVKGLDYLKRALDDQIGKAQGNEARILTDLKNRLLTTIDTLSPDYEAARAVFQQMSKPINQMDIAEEIAKKSISPLNETILPNALARSISDDTAVRATGFNKATLEKTMTPNQMNRLTALRDDVARAVAAKNSGRGAGSDTVQKLAMTNIMNRAGLPNFVGNFPGLRFASNVVYQNPDELMRATLSDALLDPAMAAKLMEGAIPSARQRAVERISAAIAMPIAAGGTLSALNAQ